MLPWNYEAGYSELTERTNTSEWRNELMDATDNPCPVRMYSAQKSPTVIVAGPRSSKTDRPGLNAAFPARSSDTYESYTHPASTCRLHRHTSLERHPEHDFAIYLLHRFQSRGGFIFTSIKRKPSGRHRHIVSRDPLPSVDLPWPKRGCNSFNQDRVSALHSDHHSS